jgi:hypothetical protein
VAGSRPMWSTRIGRLSSAGISAAAFGLNGCLVFGTATGRFDDVVAVRPCSILEDWQHVGAHM